MTDTQAQFTSALSARYPELDGDQLADLTAHVDKLANKIIQPPSELCLALRQLRNLSGKTQAHVAGELEWSLTKVLRIEKGHISVSTTDLRALLQCYGVTDSTVINDLVDKARASRKRNKSSPKISADSTER